MTSISTIMAMGMMPLNIWIYGRSFETKNLALPYGNLAMSLVSITTPVAVGMLVRWKFPKMASLITKVRNVLHLNNFRDNNLLVEFLNHFA